MHRGGRVTTVCPHHLYRPSEGCGRLSSGERNDSKAVLPGRFIYQVGTLLWFRVPLVRKGVGVPTDQPFGVNPVGVGRRRWTSVGRVGTRPEHVKVPGGASPRRLGIEDPQSQGSGGPKLP